MRLAHLALCAASSASLCSCASTTAIRSLARQNGAFVQSLSTGTTEFISGQNQLNAEGEARLQQLDADAAAAGADARQLRLAWSDADEAVRYQTLDRATAMTADAIVANMAVRPIAPVVVQPVAGGYDATIQALAKASERPRPLDQLSEFIAFAQTVRTTFTDLQDKQKAAAAAAASAAVSNDANAQKATGDTVAR